MGVLQRVAPFGIAAAIWFPSLHLFVHVDHDDRERIAQSIAVRALEAEQIDALRAVNPEWDFMSRTFTVLGLANRALVANDMDRTRLLGTIDAIIDETMRDEARSGQRRFLLGYAGAAPFRDPEGASLFVDGELLMMMMARELVAPRAELRAAAQERAARIERTMKRSPSLSGESYPDECWTFCNTTALAALALMDSALGTDHRDLMSAWVAFAKTSLVDPRTGILISSYTYDAAVKDSAEGSSIWMSAHNLLLIDPDFARDQYQRARRELGETFLGFGYAREWPRGAPSRPDVDSGPIIPLFEASAGSSGLAILGASAFGDEVWLGALMASLELAGFPESDASGRRYLASNRVGDAVLLYALSFGPLWERGRRTP